MAVGGKSKRKKTTAADLPKEVVCGEILTRIPIKSAVRFKCVSKSWLSLFSNPQFANEHLTRNATQSPNDYDCLVAQKDTKIVILSRYKEKFAIPFYLFGLVGSVCGLVCLSRDERLSLWNPAIHQSKEFTLPPSCCRYYMGCIGFGFDSVSGNYKVVVLSTNLRSASVYYSNSDSWIDVFVPDNVYLLRKSGTFFLTSSMTIVKDCPYWKFTSFAGYTHGSIIPPTADSLTPMKFDAGSDEFMLLPEFHYDKNVRGESSAISHELVDMKDCLTVIVYDQKSSKCMVGIYSLKVEEGSCVWSQMYSIGPLDFYKRHWFVSQGFYSGEIVLDDRGMFSCFDHKTDTIRRLSTTVTTVTYVRCFRYTPSMVFLEGMKSVYLTTQNRGTSGLCSRVPRRLIESLKN